MRKPREMALDDLCRDVVDKLLVIVSAEPAEYYSHNEAILKVFEQLHCSPQTKGDVFWRLDNSYGAYRQYQTWHPYLRRLRNHTDWGKKLFALFN